MGAEPFDGALTGARVPVGRSFALAWSVRDIRKRTRVERKLKESELKGASRSMYESMSEKQLEEFAETKRKGLPEHKD